MIERDRAQLNVTSIEWLPEIPREWVTTKVKYCSYVKGRVGWHGLNSIEFSDEGVHIVTGSDFANGEVGWEECRRISMERYEEDPLIQLRNEDLLITKDGTIGKLARVRNLPVKATLNSGVFLVRAIDELYVLDFLYYVLESKVFGEYVNLRSSGTTIIHLYQEVFENFQFPLPPLPEQRAIAKFLERETAKIDALVEEQRKLIKLLKEKRQALITHAVTKGLDPNVKMKDSGIEWLGEMPEHWCIVKLKYLVDMFGRIGYRGYSIEDIVNEGEGAIVLSPSNIDESGFNLSKTVFLRWEKYFESPEIMLRPNDILLVKTGWSFGKVAVVSEVGREMTINPQMLLLTNARIDPRYIVEFLKTDALQARIEMINSGSYMPTMSQANVGELVVCAPPIEESSAIASFVGVLSDRIDVLLRNVKEAIDVLQERRSALISAAVTGKIDVRDMIDEEEKG